MAEDTAYFLGAVSSSFSTNFFLRTSEMREAESSSLKDVHPRLYLLGSRKHSCIGNIT